MKGISKVSLFINNKVITAFDEVTFPDEEFAQQETAMDEPVQFEVATNHAPITLHYIVNEDMPVDWEKEFGAGNGTLRVEWKGGEKWNYSGVRLLKIGSTSVNGKGKVVRPIDVGALKRVKE